MSGDVAIEELKSYDVKLRKLRSYISKRIELHEHNQHPNPSLENELKGILFYIDHLDLESHFRNEMYLELNYLRGPVNDVKKILEMLKNYEHRIKNNIFTDFFTDREDPGIYRIDFTNGDFHVDYHNNPLEALIIAKNDFFSMELDDPNKDVVNISKCDFFKIDRRNQQNYRCTYNKLACVLAHKGDRTECPNLENLISLKEDFFKEFIEDKYKVTETTKS